jgi:hypothetical protein
VMINSPFSSSCIILGGTVGMVTHNDCHTQL